VGRWRPVGWTGKRASRRAGDATRLVVAEDSRVSAANALPMKYSILFWGW